MRSILKPTGSSRTSTERKYVRFEGLPAEVLEKLDTAPDLLSNAIRRSPKNLEGAKGLVEGFKGIKQIKEDKAAKGWKDAAEIKAGQVKSEEMKSLPKMVDALEAGLSCCLSTYRRQAEDLLQDHIYKLEDMQLQHELMVSNLIGENTLLRERLGLKPTEQVQGILFQAAPTLDDKKDKKGRKKAAQSDDDEEKAGHSSRGKGGDRLLNSRAGKNQAPGGSWQPFVAWVPNGAALNNPEPWKPMPYQDITSLVPTTAAGDKRATRKKKESDDPLIAILPGSVDRDKDSDSDHSISTVDEKEKYELCEVWKASEKMKKKMKGSGSLGDTESSAPFRDDENDFGQDNDKPFWVLNPDSNARILWDIGSLFMVLYDMIMIPMFVFSLPENIFLELMDWTTRLFWNVDIGWSCCTGYVQADGTVEFQPRAILKRYARTWMCMDLFIVASDWISLIISSGGLGISKLARIFRIVRVVRLLRLVRMQEIIANIMERIQSDRIIFCLDVFKLLIIVFFLSHFTGCGWWGLGDLLSASDQTWIEVNGVVNQGLESQYLISLHWALKQFSGGLDEVKPLTAVERLYEVTIFTLCFFVGLIMFSTLTSSLTRHYIIGGSGARQLATLKKYLKQNNIPKNLSKRLCRNAKHAISGDLTQDSVELLSVISEPLKVEMNFEMYSRVLSWHPFLNDMLCQGNPIMRPICHRAMSMLLLASGDIIFSSGESPSEPKMYIVVHGHLEYCDQYGESTVVEERQYLSEHNLWTSWRHKGTLTASSDVKMALLDATLFQDVCKRCMKKDTAAAMVFIKYASQFLADLNLNTDPSDLPDF